VMIDMENTTLSDALFDDPLDEKNIEQWKKALDIISDKYFGKLSDSMSNEDWLRDCKGMTPRDELDEEIYAAQT